MNTINFQQIGGFPLETNTLTEVQKAYSIFNAFGALAGNKKIISGCEIIGNETTNGYVYLEGELLEFRGGITQSTIVVVQEETTVEFEDQTQKGVYYTRYATFGVSGNSIPWDEFKRYYINQPMYKEVKWVGVSVQQDDLQRGWFIADGENGTDNILGRMIVGLDASQTEFNTVGKTGGEKVHILTKPELPSYNLSGSTNSSGNHRHGMEDGAGGDDGSGRVVAGNDYGTQSLANAQTKYAGTHSHSVTMSSGGGNQPHNNLPPYIVQIPIQFIG